MPRSNKRAALAALGCLVGAAGCGDAPTVAAIAVAVEVTPASDTVFVGETATRLVARAFNARGVEIPAAVVVWRSDQPFIAAVDSLTGAVTGLLPGVAAVTARAGAVADTAEVFVVNALRVVLPLDTILLARGDTFTLPVDVLVPPGTVPPEVTFSGGLPGVVAVDPATGLITALEPGSAPVVAQADTASARAGVEVLALPDTLFGFVYAGLSGGVTRSRVFGSRAFNHPTNDQRSLFQIAAIAGTQSSPLELYVVLIDSLSGPTTRVVGTMPPGGIAPGTDPVCQPTQSFVLYRESALGLTALSVAGGTVSVTSATSIAGGQAISGRLDVQLQRVDVPGADGLVRVRGTFVVPLISYGVCPT